MLDLHLTVRLDSQFGQVDVARIENIIHTALEDNMIPVVTVTEDGLSDVDSPLPTQLTNPNMGYTLPPGAQPLPPSFRP